MTGLTTTASPPFAAERISRRYAGRADFSGAAPRNSLPGAMKETADVSDAPSHPLGRSARCGAVVMEVNR